MNIQGKTALVTGASRGIGQAIAFELAKQGVKRLLIVARSVDKLAETAIDLEALGVEVIQIPLDLTDRIQVNEIGRASCRERVLMPV